MSQLNIAVDDEANLDKLNLVTTRRCWIPNQYAILCLEENLSPVETWERVYGMILQDGYSTVCAPLIQYLQYQLLGTAINNAAIFDTTLPEQPWINRDFLRH